MKSIINFNGKDLPNYIHITNIEMAILPSISPIRQAVPRMYGAIDSGNQIGGGNFNFSYKLTLKENENMLDLVDEFRQWLIGDDYKESKLIFREQPNKYYLAKITGDVNMNDLFLYGEGSFTLTASRMIKYEINEATSTAQSKLKINYNGSFDSGFNLKIKLLEEHTNVKIINNKQNKTITLLGKFPTGTLLEVDTERKIVKMNNQINMKLVDLSSRWFNLQSGMNDIEVKSQLNQAKNELSIQYRTKW